jgi:phosphoribosylformylglycinamidine (FGAM) synthase PurS component
VARKLKQLRVRRGVNDTRARRVLEDAFGNQLSSKQISKIKQGACVKVDMTAIDAEVRRAVAQVATPISH